MENTSETFNNPENEPCSQRILLQREESLSDSEDKSSQIQNSKDLSNDHKDKSQNSNFLHKKVLPQCGPSHSDIAISLRFRDACKNSSSHLKSSQKRAIQLLLFGIPLHEELEYAKRVLNSLNKGVILGFKLADPGSAILIVSGYPEAIHVMKHLKSSIIDFKGMRATLTTEEIIRLKQGERKIHPVNSFVSKSTQAICTAHSHPCTTHSQSCTTHFQACNTHSQTSNDIKHHNAYNNESPNENKEEQTDDERPNDHNKSKCESAIKVFVGCLPKTATDNMLKEIFGHYGKVIDVHILRDINANTKYSAFVYYPEINMAKEAIRTLDRQFMMTDANRPIEVRLAEKRCLRVPRTKDIINNRKTVHSEPPIKDDHTVYSKCESLNYQAKEGIKTQQSTSVHPEPDLKTQSHMKEDSDSSYFIEYMKYISQQGFFDPDNLTIPKNPIEYCD